MNIPSSVLHRFRWPSAQRSIMDRVAKQKRTSTTVGRTVSHINCNSHLPYHHMYLHTKPLGSSNLPEGLTAHMASDPANPIALALVIPNMRRPHLSKLAVQTAATQSTPRAEEVTRMTRSSSRCRSILRGFRRFGVGGSSQRRSYHTPTRLFVSAMLNSL